MPADKQTLPIVQQGVHAEALELLLYVPTPQGVHTTCPAVENDPGGHGNCTVRPGKEQKYPALHIVGEVILTTGQ